MNPWVSAIMPTRNRPELARLAVDCFHSQNYKPKELIVLDDEENPSFSDGINEPNVVYFRQLDTLTIPEKRNMCCKLARGPIIIHFDSDDWSAPGRIQDQVHRLVTQDVGLTGYHSMLFYDEQLKQAWFYKGTWHYAIGTSLCYQKAFWRHTQFPVQFPLGSDNQVVFRARDKNTLVTSEAKDFMVARIHSDTTNVAGKDTDGHNYKRVKLSSLPKGFPCLSKTTTTH